MHPVIKPYGLCYSLVMVGKNDLSPSGLFNRLRQVHASRTAIGCLGAFFLTSVMLVSMAFIPTDAVLAADDVIRSELPWWAWPLMLLIVTFILGILAVLGGVGGAVLFVPVIAGFFPFHIDFVRGAGLLVALAGAMAAGPALLKKGLADLRLSMPLAVIASASAAAGALIGLALPTNVVQICLGATILGLVVTMLLAKKYEYPEVKQACALSNALRICGIYQEVSTGQNINWRVHRTVQGLGISVIIGVMSGMFGFGADWANVPMLNLMMGAPLKVSVATSKFLLLITDTSAAWIYINSGAALPMVIVPSITGIMIGSIAGVKIIAKTKPAAVKYAVIGILFISGVRILLKGLGI